MIDSLIIKSEIYKNKENELKNKNQEIEDLKDKIEDYKKLLNIRNTEIKELDKNLDLEKLKLKKVESFYPVLKLFDELIRFNNKLLSYSKLTRNYNMFHDKDKIYINKKYLEDNFFNVYENIEFKEKLYLLKLLSLIEVSEKNRYTRKVFIDGKYKRMIVFNREILNYYCNLCS